MLSLDGDDSAFVSECSSSSASSTFSSSSSSSSKRDSGLSTTKVEDELPPSPWKFEQYNNSGRNSNNEDEGEYGGTEVWQRDCSKIHVISIGIGLENWHN